MKGGGSDGQMPRTGGPRGRVCDERPWTWVVGAGAMKWPVLGPRVQDSASEKARSDR